MTNAEARFNKSLRPREPEGSLGRTAQDGHLDSHKAPELQQWYVKPISSICEYFEEEKKTEKEKWNYLYTHAPSVAD